MSSSYSLKSVAKKYSKKKPPTRKIKGIKNHEKILQNLDMDLVYLAFIFQLYYCDFNFCNNKLYCCSLVDCWQFNCTSGLALGRKVSA